MVSIEERVTAVEERCKSNTHRIDDLDDANKTLQELVVSVKLMAQNMERMGNELEKQGARLASLERQPGDRWQTMTKTILTTVASTVAGGIIGALVMLLR